MKPKQVASILESGADRMMKWESGDIAICKYCQNEIVYDDPYWIHSADLTLQHHAEPGEPIILDRLEVLRLEINKLELKPTDLLVVKFPADATSSDIWQFQQDFNEIIPEGIKGIILWGDVQLYTISKDEATD